MFVDGSGGNKAAAHGGMQQRGVCAGLWDHAGVSALMAEGMGELFGESTNETQQMKRMKQFQSTNE